MFMYDGVLDEDAGGASFSAILGALLIMFCCFLVLRVFWVIFTKGQKPKKYVSSKQEATRDGKGEDNKLGK